MFLRQIVLAAGIVAILVVAVPATAETDATAVAGRIFSFLDKNGDNRVTDQEIGLIPVTMKSWLKKQGILKKTGFSRAEFLANSARMLTDLRRGQQVTSSPTVLTNKTPPATQKKSPSSLSPKRLLYATGAAADLLSGEMPVTVSDATSNLPSEFQECDLNRDGQIDFFEWRKCKRAEMARFYELDKNRDAVLSLAEINESDTPATEPETSSADTKTSSTQTKTAKVEPAKTGSSSPGSTTTLTKFKPGKSGSGKISQERMDTLKYLFSAMDANNNDRIDPGEWVKSKRMKPAFEKARINIKKPMDFKQFTTSYQKVFPEMKSRRRRR